ncbi:MAG: glycosyltransferase family 4 protein [Actinomycetia bacterium]|nr:glycosyltransferase family 4 protein [Actinomycetes bacterium]
MKIAIVHSFYRSDQPSGENIAVAEQMRLLRQAGHEVLLVQANSDNIRNTPSAKVRVAVDVARGEGLDPSESLRAFRPDVVHLHNLFPNIGERWLSTWPGPIVTTLHNFRLSCDNGLHLRDGRVCFDCDIHRWSGLRHRCYRNSALATLPVSWRNRLDPTRRPQIKSAAAVVALSPNAADVFRHWGVAQDRIHLIPHSVPEVAGASGPQPAHTPAGEPNLERASAVGPPQAARPGSRKGPRNRWLMFGRLSGEKGLASLVELWPIEHQLDIVGDGPLADQLRAISPASVHLLGGEPRLELLTRLKDSQYAGAVFAGKAIEGGYTLAAVEAMAAGLPLITETSCAASQLVRQYGCGVEFDPTCGSLEAALEQCSANHTDYAGAAIAGFKSNFTQEVWLERMQGLYDKVTG